MLEVREWTVEEHVDHEKISAYLKRTLNLSYEQIRTVRKYHLCGINQIMIDENSTVSTGDFISCTIPDERPAKDEPYDYPLDILYEDDSVLVINKPNDMAVTPGPENWHRNIYCALLEYFGTDAYFRLLHRIDKSTTGCLAVTKTKKATRILGRQLNERLCHREYLALVKGVISEPGRIELPLERDPQNFRRMGVREDGKYALTLYEPLEQFKNASEVKIELKTGRTHQIRVHMAAVSHPLIGDQLYGEAFEPYDTKGAVLHAHMLHFIHPLTGEPMTVTAPVPGYYQTVKEILMAE
ncbi:MAG: RluA family pseudouridine synthase [Erysipelotrichaceae bacterium]|nr:RluA family pseudouridine synthase [Erysipelotrichaceae bacterium]